MYEGQMMDSVRGRAISREGQRSIDNGNDAIEAVLRLAEATDGETSARWRGLCRAWIEDNGHSTILEGASIARLATVTELLGADVEPYRLPTGAHFFPGMDRMVYRGSGWASCIAMCSDRIAWYESGNGENEYGSLTSQGMTYLYLPDDDNHFDDEFWATCDLQGLPGITVDTTPLPPNAGGEWGSGTPDAEWAGGAVLGDIAIAGQHLVAPGDSGLTARKTWILLPDAMIAMGSDISTGTDAEVKTVIEHRNLGSEDGGLVIEGNRPGADPVRASSATWAHVEGVGGYLFLGPQEIRASLAHRDGSWSRNHVNGSEEVHERVYATIEALHPDPGGNYAYAILPGVDEAATRAAAEAPVVDVIRNDETVQAIRDGRRLAANFWAAGEVQNLTADQPLSLISSRNGRGIDFAVSDPTQQLDTVTFTQKAFPATSAEGSDRVSIRHDRGTVSVTVDVSDMRGVPVSFRLTR